MALSAFADPSQPPAPDALAATLGPAAARWTAAIDEVRAIAGTLDATWNHAGARYGWSLRLARAGRNLVYLTPQQGRFFVGVALGAKAIAAAEAAGHISPRTRAVIDAAPRYAEGRGIRFEVTTQEDVAVARELAKIKVGR